MSKGRIAFQGELGANSHEACSQFFPDYEPVPYPSFEDAFEGVKSGDWGGFEWIAQTFSPSKGPVPSTISDSGLNSSQPTQ